MINVLNQEHYIKVTEEARKLDLLPLLLEKLDYLASYGNKEEETCCNLGYDFAPMSFTFTMQRKRDGEWKNWFAGGLIFHPGKTGVDESLSIEVTGLDAPHWSVHT